MECRSPRKRVERACWRYVYRHSFQDVMQAETVSTLERDELLGVAKAELTDHDHFFVSWVPPVEKGEVLSDSRGRGSRQR